MTFEEPDSPHRSYTPSTVIAYLASRSAYHLARSLAHDVFVRGLPLALTWDEDPASDEGARP